MSNTFFNVKLDLEPNLIDMIYDILRMSTIQIITQIMFYMNNSSLSLLNETFVKTFIFINLSIVFYYLVIRKVFSFVSDDYLNEVSKPYAKTPPMKSVTSPPPPPPSNISISTPSITSSPPPLSTAATSGSSNSTPIDSLGINNSENPSNSSANSSTNSSANNSANSSTNNSANSPSR